jgi:hypothetical protein
VRFNADFKSMNRFSTCAWIDTSRAATGLVADEEFGRHRERASDADAARWPPEN